MPINFKQFTKHQNLKYGFSTRKDGSMNRHTQKENRENYFKKIGIDPNRVVTADLIHGQKAIKVTEEMGGKMIQDADGLITNEKNLFLSATGADCFLIYFYDSLKQAVGISHTGWCGLLAGVIKNTIEGMILNFGSAPQNILVGISPGIRKCHFKINPEDKTKYENYPGTIIENKDEVFIDLAGIIKFQLQDNKVLEKNIEDSGICTYCDKDEYFSYRRDKPSEVQPMVGYIGLI